jgi:hypothetical protein
MFASTMSLVAVLVDPLVNVPLGLLDDLLDPRRMDAAIGHELLEGFGRDRLPNAIESRRR